MTDITKEALYFSGKSLLSYLNELRSLTGEKTVLMVLRKSGWLDTIRDVVATRHELIAPYELHVTLNEQIVDVFGENAQRNIIYAAAKPSFSQSFEETKLYKQTRFWLINNPESSLRLRTTLESIARLLEGSSERQIVIDESSSHYHLSIRNCTDCYGIEHSHKPVCFYTVGLIRGGLHSFLGKDDHPVQELACSATGDRNCEFIIRKFPFSENEKGSGKTGFLTLPAHLRFD